LRSMGRTMTIPVAILGATGHTSAKLIRLIELQPHLEVAHLSVHSQSGKRTGKVLPGCAGSIAGMTLAAADAALPGKAQLGFTDLIYCKLNESVKASGLPRRRHELWP